jgi:hypothetical protein
VSLSFGYLATDTFKRADGIQELRELDLFEISLTPAPANPDTRILSLKSTESRAIDEPDVDYDDLRARMRADMFALLTGPVDEATPDAETLRKQCNEVAIRTKSRPPVQVAQFDC